MKIKDIVKPKKEVLEGSLHGVIQSYKVDSEEDRIESNPKRLFSSTYPSNAIQNVIERVNDKLVHKTNKGSFVLSGPRGSGKSHALVTLYHLFKNPEIASDWLDYWGIQLKKLEKSQSVIVSAQEIDPDLLWKPIFERAERKDLLEQVGKYPTTKIIEELVEDKTFAIFLDELGTWWKTFDEEQDKKLLSKNEMFLLALLEVANDKNKQLFVFTTTYGTVSGLDRTLNRTNPYREDMTASGDREKIIFHRLFEDPRKEIEEKAIRSIVSSYIQEYEEPINIGHVKRYEERFVRSYPFHPQLVEVLDGIYEGVKERQSIRGEMRVLAETLARNYDTTDAILLSDLNEKAFRAVDNELVNKFETDTKKRIGEIDYGKELLKVVLLFSLEKMGAAATESDILLGTFKPTAGMTLDQLSMSLENIYGNAHYLHKDDSHYSIKKERNVTALIKSERPNVEEKEIKEELKNLTKKEIFDNRAYIYELEKDGIPDDVKSPKFVVTLNPYGDEDQIKGELESFLKEKQYKNNYVFIIPKRSLLADSDLVGKIKNICAGKNLKNRVDEKIEEIERRVKEDIKESKSYIKDLYGHWAKWAPKGDSYEVSVVKKSIKPDIHEIRKVIKTDESLLKEKLLEEVKGKEGGRKIGSLLDDFKKMRKYPLISDDNIFYSLLKKLNREDIIIRGDRGKEYWDSDPKGEIKDSWEIIDINFVSPPEVEEEVEVGGQELEGEEVPEGIEEKKKTKLVKKSAHGNSGRAVATKYEMSIDEDSLERIKNVKLDINFEELDKQGLLKLIKELPNCDFIKSEIEVEERED